MSDYRPWSQRKERSLSASFAHSARVILTTDNLLIAILFVAIAAMAVRQPADTDTWWHLKSGQLMWETGKILRSDPFSYTMAGRPWIDHGWLVQLIFWPTYASLGLQGLSLLLSAIVTVAFVLVYLQCEGRPYVAAFATLLAAVASSVIWSARPQIFSFLLAAAVAYLLHRFKVTDNTRWLWPLPVLVVVWVNSHGGFVIAFILMGSYLVGEALNRLTYSQPPDSAVTPARLTPLIVATLCSALAVLLNPNTVGMIPYAFQTVSIGPLQNYILEWAAPDFHSLQFHPFIWLLLLTVAALGLSRRRADWTELVLVCVFAYMGLLAVRNVALFALVAAPVLSRHAVAALDDLAGVTRLAWLVSVTGEVRSARTRPTLALSNLLLLVLVIVGAGIKIGLDLARMDDPEVWGQGLPVDAARWLTQHELHGEMFNSYNWGGYLIWSLYPDKEVFVDGRTDLYALNSQVMEDYVMVHSLRPGWDGILDKYRIDYVVTERTGLLDQALAQVGDWDLVYKDELAVVRVRKEPTQ